MPLLLVMAAVFVIVLVLLKGLIVLAIGALIYKCLRSDGATAQAEVSESAPHVLTLHA